MNDTMNTNITILRGHTSPETAYVVNDYPYGFRLRCKIRYWLETKQGHGTRLMSQTTNPKIATAEVWNKPKGSTYSRGVAFLYLDDVGHVQWTTVGDIYHGPKEFALFHAQFGPLVTQEEAAMIAQAERVSRHYSPGEWARWEAEQAALTGSTPAL